MSNIITAASFVRTVEVAVTTMTVFIPLLLIFILSQSSGMQRNLRILMVDICLPDLAFLLVRLHELLANTSHVNSMFAVFKFACVTYYCCSLFAILFERYFAVWRVRTYQEGRILPFVIMYTIKFIVVFLFIAIRIAVDKDGVAPYFSVAIVIALTVFFAIAYTIFVKITDANEREVMSLRHIDLELNYKSNMIECVNNSRMLRKFVAFQAVGLVVTGLALPFLLLFIRPHYPEYFTLVQSIYHLVFLCGRTIVGAVLVLTHPALNARARSVLTCLRNRVGQATRVVRSARDGTRLNAENVEQERLLQNHFVRDQWSFDGTFEEATEHARSTQRESLRAGKRPASGVLFSAIPPDPDVDVDQVTTAPACSSTVRA